MLTAPWSGVQLRSAGDYLAPGPLPLDDAGFGREVRAAAMFGGIDLIEWALDVLELREDAGISWASAAIHINADLGILALDEMPDATQRAALRDTLRALTSHALGSASGLLRQDVEAVLARPRGTYDGLDRKLARDLVAAIAPAWAVADERAS